MLHVVETSAILAVAELEDAAEVFDMLTEKIRDREVTFPDGVLSHLRRRAAGEYAVTWANAVRNERCNKAADWGYQEWISTTIPEIVGEFTFEHGPIAAVAQAFQLRENSIDVTVVTEDWKD